MCLENNVNLSRKIIAFGAGSCAEKFLKRYPLSNISFFCDNDPKKIGGNFLGKEIYSPDILKNQNYDEFMIILTSEYEKEISEQLNEIGFKEYVHYFKLTWVDQYFLKVYDKGHFYSPIPDIEEIYGTEFKSYKRNSNYIGMDLNVPFQQNLFNKFIKYKQEFYEYLKHNHTRFTINNNYFPSNDAALIYAMLKNEPPKRVIEVGSGYSSAAFLDAKDILGLNVKFTFIDPLPERLKSLLRDSDRDSVEIIESNVQLVSNEVFQELQEGDILFIDSSHVSKLESDVNYLMFEIIPLLNKGVRVHIHDIFRDFEYPEKWLKLGWYWNESYILRSFLQYNSSFQIEYFSDYLYNLNQEKIIKPQDGFGASLWMRRIK